MGAFIVKRLIVTLLVLVATSIISFSLLRLSGDPAVAMAGENASPAEIAAIRTLYGFDRPYHAQYMSWLGRFLSGDFGRSTYLKEDVRPVLARHIPVTAQLGVFSLTFAVFAAVPLGVVAALGLTAAVAHDDVPAWWLMPLAVVALVITGAGAAAAMVSVRVAVPVPPLLVALSVTEDVPAAAGVPEIKPDPVFTVSPAGNPDAP